MTMPIAIYIKGKNDFSKLIKKTVSRTESAVIFAAITEKNIANSRNDGIRLREFIVSLCIGVCCRWQKIPSNREMHKNIPRMSMLRYAQSGVLV